MTTQPQQRTVLAYANADLGGGVPCLTCGYDLRGLPGTGGCPECGNAVAPSLAAAVEMTPRSLAAMAFALRMHVLAMVLIGVIAAAVWLGFFMFGTSDVSAGVLLAALGMVLPVTILGLVAAWRLADLPPGTTGMQPQLRNAVWFEAAAVTGAFVLVLMGFIGMAFDSAPEMGLLWLAGMGFALLSGSLPRIWIFNHALEKLLRTARMGGAARWARVYRWLKVIADGAIVGLPLLSLLSAAVGLSAMAIVLGLAAAFAQLFYLPVVLVGIVSYAVWARQLAARVEDAPGPAAAGESSVGSA